MDGYLIYDSGDTMITMLKFANVIITEQNLPKIKMFECVSICVSVTTIRF